MKLLSIPSSCEAEGCSARPARAVAWTNPASVNNNICVAFYCGVHARDSFLSLASKTMVDSCNCEHKGHGEDDKPGWHKYGAKGPLATMRQAQYVGRVCAECAEGHMKEYLV